MPRPQHRHDGDDEHDDGEGHHHVHKAHEKRVQNAAEIGREQADERAHDERDAGGRQADDEVIPGPPDDAGENIPPQLVGAPDMLCRRRGEHGREVLVRGGLACDEPREQRREHHAKQDQAPCGERKVAAKHVPYGAPPRCLQLLPASVRLLYCSLTRGSSTEYKISVSRFTAMMITANRITQPCTAG